MYTRPCARGHSGREAKAKSQLQGIGEGIDRSGHSRKRSQRLRKYTQSQGVAKKPRKGQNTANANGDGNETAPVQPAAAKTEKPTRQHRFNPEDV